MYQLLNDLLLWGIRGMENSGRLRTLTVDLCYLGGYGDIHGMDQQLGCCL